MVHTKSDEILTTSKFCGGNFEFAKIEGPMHLNYMKIFTDLLSILPTQNTRVFYFSHALEITLIHTFISFIKITHQDIKPWMIQLISELDQNVCHKVR